MASEAKTPVWGIGIDPTNTYNMGCTIYHAANQHMTEKRQVKQLARLVVNTQNTLFADTLRRTLGKDGDFTVYTVDRPGDVLAEVNRVAAEIVLLEVTAYTPWKLSERLEHRG